MARYEEILKEENLGAKYQMIVYNDNNTYDELYFTSLTDFNFFLLSDHYDKIVHATDDEIQVINIETGDIVFSSKEDD